MVAFVDNVQGVSSGLDVLTERKHVEWFSVGDFVGAEPGEGGVKKTRYHSFVDVRRDGGGTIRRIKQCRERVSVGRNEAEESSGEGRREN